MMKVLNVGGTSIERRQPIIDEAAIDELTVLINEIFEQRLTETENRRTLVLRMALQWIDHFPRVGQRHVAQNFHLTGFSIDFHFRRAETDFPERRGIAERNIFVLADFEITAPPDLSLPSRGSVAA